MRLSGNSIVRLISLGNFNSPPGEFGHNSLIDESPTVNPRDEILSIKKVHDVTRLRIVAVMNDRMDRLPFVSAALVIPLLIDFAFGITAVASPLGDVVMLCTVASLVLGFVAILRVRKSNSKRRSSLVLAVFPFAVVLVTLLIDSI